MRDLETLKLISENPELHRAARRAAAIPDEALDRAKAAARRSLVEDGLDGNVDVLISPRR